ncbi:MAG TPA: hypothetical protein IAB62_08205 [Candidatus Coprocola pullicola]|nr:hypothetical protein [Candidatus Coprocola pullicola]
MNTTLHRMAHKNSIIGHCVRLDNPFCISQAVVQEATIPCFWAWVVSIDSQMVFKE